MCGFPFSGKSTFAKQVVSQTSIVYVSFDDMWVELLKKIPELTYDTALPYIDKQIEDMLKQGLSVIYDSTNLKSDRRMSLIYLAEKVGAKGVVVYIPTTVEETLKRQAQSLIDHSHHVVDKENVDKAFEHLEVPADAVVLESEEDKERFLKELAISSPKASQIEA
jgi:predicted kinase